MTESTLLSERESVEGPKAEVRLHGGGPEEVDQPDVDEEECDRDVIADLSSDALVEGGG